MKQMKRILKHLVIKYQKQLICFWLSTFVDKEESITVLEECIYGNGYADFNKNVSDLIYNGKLKESKQYLLDSMKFEGTPHYERNKMLIRTKEILSSKYTFK